MTVLQHRAAKWFLIFFLGIMPLLTLVQLEAQAATEVYVVYSARDNAEKDKLMKTLPKNISTKAFNINFLAFADYSG